jgi:hypothetical protein
MSDQAQHEDITPPTHDGDVHSVFKSAPRLHVRTIHHDQFGG